MADTSEPAALLRDAKSVLFVDWAHQDIPGSVVRTGRTVYGHEPHGFGVHAIADETDDERARGFPVAGGGYLTMTTVDPPESVDLVNTYRPPDEQPEIAQNAIAIGAKSFWVHPGQDSSDAARTICTDAGVVFIDGVDIRDIV
ncbi:MAG: uncharacterized protein QOF21_2123 [Actinomycetota bacterium]